MAAQTIPHKIIELNRTILERSVGTAGSAVRVVADSAGRVASASLAAGRTVVGQGRSAVDRTATTGRRGAAEVAGQADAQGEGVSETVKRETHRVVDRAQDAVADRPAPGTPYEEWTREQLYERAQELDIEGRSSMSKSQLVNALRA